MTGIFWSRLLLLVGGYIARRRHAHKNAQVANSGSAALATALSTLATNHGSLCRFSEDLLMPIRER